MLETTGKNSAMSEVFTVVKNCTTLIYACFLNSVSSCKDSQIPPMGLCALMKRNYNENISLSHWP